MNWKQGMMEEDLFDLISPIEYLPSPVDWESGETQVFIRALCPSHGKSLFVKWEVIIEDRDVLADASVTANSSIDYLGHRMIFSGYDGSSPTTRRTHKWPQEISNYVCMECRRASGHKLSFLELFG
jgi:hypothetical protein